jgi:hypothetical protein
MNDLCLSNLYKPIYENLCKEKFKHKKQDLIFPGVPLFYGKRFCAELLDDTTDVLYPSADVK